MSLNIASSRHGVGAKFCHQQGFGARMHDVVRQEAVDSANHGESAGHDQRSVPRLRLLIRAAKLVGAAGEYLCVVRDASEAGVSVKLFHPLPPEGELSLELQNGDRYPLLRVWEDEGKAGFRFEVAADLERIVESPSEFARRPVRVNLDAPCVVRFADREVSARLCNISQQGGRIVTTEHLSLVQRIRLHGDGLPEVAAKVRWRRGDTYGLSFENNLQFEELARITFGLQHGDGQGKSRAA